jgi:hypothetical protein
MVWGAGGKNSDEARTVRSDVSTTIAFAFYAGSKQSFQPVAIDHFRASGPRFVWRGVTFVGARKDLVFAAPPTNGTNFHALPHREDQKANTSLLYHRRQNPVGTRNSRSNNAKPDPKTTRFTLPANWLNYIQLWAWKLLERGLPTCFQTSNHLITTLAVGSQDFYSFTRSEDV